MSDDCLYNVKLNIETFGGPNLFARHTIKVKVVLGGAHVQQGPYKQAKASSCGSPFRSRDLQPGKADDVSPEGHRKR